MDETYVDFVQGDIESVSKLLLGDGIGLGLLLVLGFKKVMLQLVQTRFDIAWTRLRHGVVDHPSCAVGQVTHGRGHEVLGVLLLQLLRILIHQRRPDVLKAAADAASVVDEIVHQRAQVPLSGALTMGLWMFEKTILRPEMTEKRVWAAEARELSCCWLGGFFFWSAVRSRDEMEGRREAGC